MAATSPITRETAGKTFIVASSLLGIAALAQIGAVGWAFGTGFKPVGLGESPAEMTNPVAVARSNPAAQPPDEALNVVEPFPEAALPGTTAAPAPAPPPPQITAAPSPTPIAPPPKPAPIAETKLAPPPETRFQELIEQGRRLRDRGDMGGALTRLREAATLEPRDPQAIAEIAITFEKMNLLDRASEQWKRIYDMGEAAGSYFIAADARLKQSQALALMQAQSAQPPGAEVSSTNPQATLGLGQITSEEVPDTSAQRHFVLRVPLRARPKTRVDVRDVVIQVLFYDMLDEKTVTQTNANVSNRWASAPPDWTDSDSEVLEVEYTLPKPDAKDTRRESRKYFGYVVRLYYKEELQDSRAEPARLAAQFPPPQLLPKETTP